MTIPIILKVTLKRTEMILKVTKTTIHSKTTWKPKVPDKSAHRPRMRRIKRRRGGEKRQPEIEPERRARFGCVKNVERSSAAGRPSGATWQKFTGKTQKEPMAMGLRANLLTLSVQSAGCQCMSTSTGSPSTSRSVRLKKLGSTRLFAQSAGNPLLLQFNCRITKLVAQERGRRFIRKQSKAKSAHILAVISSQRKRRTWKSTQTGCTWICQARKTLYVQHVAIPMSVWESWRFMWKLFMRERNPGNVPCVAKDLVRRFRGVSTWKPTLEKLPGHVHCAKSWWKMTLQDTITASFALGW